MIQELREELDKLNAEAATLLQEESKRELTPDEDARADALVPLIEEKRAALKKEDRKVKLASVSHREQPASNHAAPSVSVRTQKSHDVNDAVKVWLTGGDKCTREQFDACDHYEVDPKEQRLSLRTLTSTASPGSNTIQTTISSEYEKKLAYFWRILGAVDSFNTPDSSPFTLPQFDYSALKAVKYSTEDTKRIDDVDDDGNAQNPTGSAVTFGAVYYSSEVVTVNEKLLQNSTVDLMGLLMDMFAEEQGRALEDACVSTTTGSSTAAEGILHGLSVGANLATGNVLTWQKMIDLLHSVDIAYRDLPGSGYVMNDTTFAALRKIADDDNRPLFNVNLQGSVSPNFAGYPIYISNKMNTFASPGDNTPFVLFGALKKYRIRVCGTPTLVRFNELYRRKRKIGMMLEHEWDARLVGHAGCLKTLNFFDS